MDALVRADYKKHGLSSRRLSLFLSVSLSVHHFRPRRGTCSSLFVHIKIKAKRRKLKQFSLFLSLTMESMDKSLSLSKYANVCARINLYDNKSSVDIGKLVHCNR